MSKDKPSKKEVENFRALAKEAAKFHFGTSPKRIVYRSSGLTNFVFSFANADGEFVVRISPDAASLSSFMKEQWAERAAREAGVPTPRILEVGFELIQSPYMISASASGAEATHHPKRLKILHEMGRFAARINGIRTKGFGETFDWSENKLSLNSNFKQYLYEEFCFESKIEVLRKNKIVNDAMTKKLNRVFSDAAKTDPKPVLNHGDVRLKNVIASEDGKINAIIDWENCTSNVAPAWELSLALHDLGVDEKQEFLAGYGLNEKKLLEHLPLIRAFNIANYAQAVEQASNAKNKNALSRFRLRMSGGLDLYSL